MKKLSVPKLKIDDPGEESCPTCGKELEAPADQAGAMGQENKTEPKITYNKIAGRVHDLTSLKAKIKQKFPKMG